MCNGGAGMETEMERYVSMHMYVFLEHQTGLSENEIIFFLFFVEFEWKK